MDGLEELLDVQRHDLELDRIRHRLDTLEERSLLEESAAAREASSEDLTRAEDAKKNLIREERRLEDELALLTEQIDTANTKLYGGVVKANRELVALQADIEMLERRRGEFEEAALELMVKVDEAEAECVAARTRAESATAGELDAKRKLGDAEAKLDIEREKAENQRRQAFEAAANSPGLELYLQLREAGNATAVSRLEDGICGACRLRVSNVAAAELRVSESIPRCEHCSMILLP